MRSSRSATRSGSNSRSDREPPGGAVRAYAPSATATDAAASVAQPLLVIVDSGLRASRRVGFGDLESGAQQERQQQENRSRDVRHLFAVPLERGIAPHGTDGAAEAFHGAGGALHAALLLVAGGFAHQARDGRVPEADAERQGDQHHGEPHDGMSQRGAYQADHRADEPDDEGRFVAKALDDRSDEAALHDDTQNAEYAEEVTGSRHVELKAAFREQRERRLKDRKREPVGEVDNKHPPDVRPPQQRREIAKRHPRAGLRPMD